MRISCLRSAHFSSECAHCLGMKEGIKRSFFISVLRTCRLIHERGTCYQEWIVLDLLCDMSLRVRYVSDSK